MSTTRTQKGRLEIAQTVEGDATLLRLKGAIDESFTGFDSPTTTQVVLELSGLTRITSYGVRQWIRGRDQLSHSANHVYYLNCPPFFVDQLNMVLNFGGNGQVLTASVPYSCPSCKNEKWVLVDVMARADELTTGKAPDEICEKCRAPLAMDELPETFFGFVKGSAARSMSPPVSALLAQEGLYRSDGQATTTAAADRAQVRKLVHDRVTYFQIVGVLDKRFRARSLLEGTEGEVVLDLRELGSITDEGTEEWNRLRAGLKDRASLVTFVDVPPAVLDGIEQGKLSLGSAVVYSVLGAHHCDNCGRKANESIPLGVQRSTVTRVCSACGGTARFCGRPEHLKVASRFVSGPILAASREVIERREDLLSRARIEASAPEPAKKSSGAILGKYEIARALSVGGMAEVFLAVQKGIGGFEKPVALKRIRRSLLERRHFAVEQFLNEAKIAATLAHPNITQIFDVGEEDGLLYLAMEYVHGKDLRALIHRVKNRNEKLPLGTVFYLVRDSARALHHAYTTLDLSGRQLKAVHRDVSPHNILCGFDGSVKLVDFGVATSAATSPHDPHTIAGKHNYMSPEQVQGGSLDARSDLFSLGVVFYELLTGERPFAKESRDDTLNALIEGRYTPPSKLRPDLPAGVDQLVARLLSVRPSERYSDGNRLAEEIDAFAGKNGIAVGPEWLKANLTLLFPSGEADHPEQPSAHSYTPRSDSWSLEPTFSHGPVRGAEAVTNGGPVRGGAAAPEAAAARAASEPALAQPPAAAPGGRTPPRGVGFKSGSLPSLDENTMSQIVNPIFTRRMRVGTILIMAVMVGFLVYLWWRY